MLDIQTIRDNPERVRQALRNKGLGDTDMVDRVLHFDVERRTALTTLQDVQARLNVVSREIGQLMREGNKDQAQERIAETGRLKDQVKELEERTRLAETSLEALLLEVPNLPHESVPIGHSPEENVVVHEEGLKPGFDFEPLPHW